MEHQAYQTPKEDLMNSALEHYEEASNAIHHWNSDIPKAIRHYYTGDQKLNKKGLVSLGVCIGLVVGFFIGLCLLTKV